MPTTSRNGNVVLLGRTIVVPRARGEGPLEDGIDDFPDRIDVASNSPDTETGAAWEAAEVHPDIETVPAVVIDGCYVKRNHIIYVGLVGCVLVLGCIVGLAVGFSRPPTAPSGFTSQQRQPMSFIMPSTIEKFALSLPESTQTILRHTLPHEANETNWYSDERWTQSDEEFQFETPQAKAWKWLMTHQNLESRSMIDITDRFALATLYFATDGPRWKNNTSWLSKTEDVCTWWTEVMDQSVDIYQNYLEFCRGSGLGHAQHGLKELLLSSNGLNGTLPPELGLISGLKAIRIEANALHGVVPDLVWQSLRRVTDIEFQNNELSGSIPTLFGLLTSLTAAKLNSNCFTGRIPSEIGRLSSLWLFDASKNRLTGSIPTELGRATTLKFLHLSNNALSETIPSQIGRLRALEMFEAHANQLSGSVPSEIASCKLLFFLDIACNPLVNGSIPTQLARLSLLSMIYLSNSSMTGTLPSQLARLTKLITLDISGTRVSGTVPSQLGELSQLTNLRLFESDMSGSIPSSVCQAFTLQNANAGLVLDCDRVTCDCNCSCT